MQKLVVNSDVKININKNLQNKSKESIVNSGNIQ